MRIHKKIAVITAAALMFSVCIITAACSKEPVKSEEMDPILYEALMRHIEAEEMVQRIEQSVYEVLGDTGEPRKESIFPLKFSNTDGAYINYYCYNYKNLELNDNPMIILEIFDPAAAESTRTCKIDDEDAVIYQYNERSYLWWSPYEGTILLFDYDAEEFPEKEIIEIAESCK